MSYFDITPDIKFILGPDSRISNLLHCLGAGQALKYAPIFGELLSELILEDKTQEFDLSEFSIRRFTENSLKEFWQGGKRQVDENIL